MSLLLSCDALSKKYANKLALNNVSFELRKGEPVALIGENGAGKTTLISLICGFIKPTSGVINFAEQGAGKTTIGALPQDAVLDGGFTIGTQLAYFARLQGMSRLEANNEVHKVLEWVDLANVVNDNPEALSHGMSKRVSIAQSLIGQPDFVLLDEPTAGLDPKNALKVRECIQALKSEVTFLISSHNLSELERICRHLLFLDNGKLTRNEALLSKDVNEYLSIVFQTPVDNAFIAKVSDLDGVIRADLKQADELLIEYTLQPNNQSIEIMLFQLMSEEQVSYRTLQKGQSLESRLFI